MNKLKYKTLLSDRELIIGFVSNYSAEVNFVVPDFNQQISETVYKVSRNFAVFKLL